MIPDPFVVQATVDTPHVAPSDIVLEQHLIRRDLHDIYPNLGKNVREAQLRSGLTQAELAAQVGLTRGSITNLEGRKQGVSLPALKRIADALGVEVCDLLNG